MRLRTIASAISRLAAAGGLLALATSVLPGMQAFAADATDGLLVTIAPGKVEYYTTAEALVNGMPAMPARLTVEFDRPMRVMKRLVSQAEYAECVREEGCRPLHKDHRDDVSPELPVVGVSWDDATAYARWYSARTGQLYRLPTYAEWVHLAGEVFKEDLRLDLYRPDDANNPAQRWLAEYALESQRKAAADPFPRPFGTFGSNAAGILDLGGNVWEWTNTCHVRRYVDEEGNEILPATENCGIRVVAGSHHSLITDFMRDPKAGACSVGIPPSNLGIRLIVDESGS